MQWSILVSSLKKILQIHHDWSKNTSNEIPFCSFRFQDIKHPVDGWWIWTKSRVIYSSRRNWRSNQQHPSWRVILAFADWKIVQSIPLNSDNGIISSNVFSIVQPNTDLTRLGFVRPMKWSLESGSFRFITKVGVVNWLTSSSFRVLKTWCMLLSQLRNHEVSGRHFCQEPKPSHNDSKRWSVLWLTKMTPKVV